MSDSSPHALEHAVLPYGLSIFKFKAIEVPELESSRKEVSLPLTKEFARIDHKRAWGNGRSKLLYGLFHAFFVRGANAGPIVFFSVSDHGPPVVFSLLYKVDLVPASGAMFLLPKFSC